MGPWSHIVMPMCSPLSEPSAKSRCVICLRIPNGFTLRKQFRGLSCLEGIDYMLLDCFLKKAHDVPQQFIQHAIR